MNVGELFEEAEKASETWWSEKHENDVCPTKAEFYNNMMQDLRAIGKTDEQIWHEFITDAFIFGFMTARKDRNDKIS